MKPGEYFLDTSRGDIVANAGRAVAKLLIQHTGDRPIQVGSHFHFYEINRALAFDRAKARGMRLDIPAGTAVRFEPGDSKEVSLVAIAGDRIMFGHSGAINGPL